MKQSQNSIDNSIFAFKYESKSVASRCNNVIETIFDTQILPELEVAITNKIPKDIIVQLGTLEIDIGNINEKELEYVLAERIKESLEEALQRIIGNKHDDSSGIDENLNGSPNSHLLKVFELYLKRGYFPDWIDRGTSLEQLLLDLIDQSQNDLILVLRRYSANETVMKRLSFSIETKVSEALLYAINRVNYEWIISFRDNLLALESENGFSKFGSKGSIQMIHYIITTHLLKETSNSLNKIKFSESVLSSYISEFSVNPISLVQSLKRISDKSFITPLLLTTLHPIQKSKTKAPLINEPTEAELGKFITSVNTNQSILGSDERTFSKEQIIDFIKTKRTRALLTDSLSDKGVAQILKLYYENDVTELMVFISSFLSAVEKIKDDKKHPQQTLSVNSLVLITILFLDKKSSRILDYHDYFLFLVSLIGVKKDALEDSPPLKHFIKTQIRFDKAKLDRRLKDKDISEEIITIKKELSTVIENLEGRDDEFLSESNNSVETVEIHRKRIIEYYLDFGYLPKGFIDLSLTDVQKLFQDLIHIKDSFLDSKLRKHQNSKELLYKRIEFLLNDENSEALSQYLEHYFKDSYEDLGNIIKELQKQLNLSSDPNVIIGKSYNKIILKSLIASKGEHKPSLFLFYITRSFIESLPTDLTISSSLTTYLLSKTKLSKPEDINSSGASSNLEVKREIRRDYYRLLTLIRQWAIQKLPSEQQVGLLHKLEYYVKMFPEVLQDIVRQKTANFPFVMAHLKRHLPNETWQRFKEIVFTNLNFKNQTILYQKQLDAACDEIESPAIDLISEIKKLRGYNSSKTKNILSIILSNTEHFNRYYSVTKRDKIPDEIAYGSKRIQAYLDTLFVFVPKSLTGISTDFWQKLVLRFAIQMRIEENKFSAKAFSKAFMEHLYQELIMINEERIYYEVINELSVSKSKVIDTILEMYKGADNKMIQEVPYSVLNEDSLENADAKSSIRYDLAILVFYAHTGLIPWWSEKKSLTDLINNLYKKSQWYGTSFEVVFLQMETEEKFVEPLLAKITDTNIKALSHIIANHSRLRVKWEKSLSKLSLSRNRQVENNLNRTNHDRPISKSEDVKEVIPLDTNKIMADIEGTEVKIHNAGLVLVWPFLTRFFEHLSLLENGKFLDEESRNRGVYLLQNLAYNRTNYPEYELVLNKLLVGMPVYEHLSPFINLSEEEKELTRSLMNGVISNWDKMKNSSIEGLQETFIQREGVLRFKKENTTLIINKKGVDVLLDTIPWNISLIRLPWMEKPIHVEWR